MSTPLTADQAAARLGVKRETLYAYVSRGALSRTRTAHGSFFDPLEVEAFAARRRGRPPMDSDRVPAGSPLGVVDTDLALIEDDDLFLRGERATDLAAAHPFDDTAAWVWGEERTGGRRLRAPATFVDAARRLVSALPVSASSIDRAAVAVHGLAAADPLRAEVSPAALVRVGEIVVAGIPRALTSTPAPDSASVPSALWRALRGADPSGTEEHALHTALTLCIDHDLAVSTLAARVAASARASGYAVVSAALGAFDSPLHGTASAAAARLVRAVRDGDDAGAALRAHLRSGTGAPGFGQALYRGIDPRAAGILRRVGDLDDGPQTLDAVARIRAEMTPTGLEPNVDLGLAALTVAAGMPDDAGALVFALGRTVGWIAHAMHELDERPLRLRPRGRYVGALPW